MALKYEYAWMDPKGAQQAVQKAEAGRATGDQLVNRIYEEINKINTVKRLQREAAGARIAETGRQFGGRLALGRERLASRESTLEASLADRRLLRSDRATRVRRARPYQYAGLGVSGATAYTDYLAGKKAFEQIDEQNELLKSIIRRP